MSPQPRLSTEDRIWIEQRVANEGKSIIIAYLLWFFFGFLGAHRFYLNEPIGSFGIILLTALGLLGPGMQIPYAFILFVIAAGWVALDLFLIPGLVARSREEMRRDLIAAMGETAAAEEDPQYPGHEPRRMR